MTDNESGGFGRTGMRRIGMRTAGRQVALAAVVALIAPACATRGFVREQSAAANARIEALAGAVEETQERTAENAARIEDVDQRDEQAAQQTAQLGQQLAVAATEAARAVHARIDRMEEATNRLIFEVTLSETQGNFGNNQTELPEAARARIDELVARLQAEQRNAYLEIEGHTDSAGSEPYNLNLGMARAEAVKRYLHDQHQVPLHRMNLLSYGETRPAASNDTPEGRAQNRRVVIRILS